MTGNGNDGRLKTPGREADQRPLPKRFYQRAEAAPSGSGDGHVVLLDGRVAKTPGRRELNVPSARLAEAIASEWDAQGERIDPAGMPFTRLVNTAIDGVAARSREVAADVARYGGSDLLCYRADHPEGLAARQAELWDPLIAWANQRLGLAFIVTDGLMPVEQPPETGNRLLAIVAPLDVFRLTTLHVMTSLMGSVLLSLAVLEGRLTPEAAWQAAHVDEDWQIAEWGEDAEAAQRRAARWQEMRAAAGMAALLDA